MTYARDDILELLSFPRRLLEMSIELENCSHAGFLDAADPGCHECDYLKECRWLYSNDEFVDLSAKPIEDLIEALDSAAELIEAQLARSEHNSRNCRCESCTWVRDARSFLNARETQAPP